MELTSKAACPCGLGASLEACCGRYLGGQAAPTAEALMRSRYVAFVLGSREARSREVTGDEPSEDFVSYLVKTHHPDHREPRLAESLAETLRDIKWLSLEVRTAREAGDTAQVEFVASYSLAGQAAQLQELSSFVREGGMWLYTTGELDPAQNGPTE